LRTGGDFEQARRVLSEAVALAEEPPIELRARLELAGVRLAGDRAQSADELLEIAAEAVGLFEAVGDDRSLARTWRWIAYAHGPIRGRWAASREAAEQALDLYNRTGWSTSGCLSELANADHTGPTPAQEAIEQCRSMLARADLGGQARVLCRLGGLEAMVGRVDEARKLLAAARAMFTELGQDLNVATDCSLFEARIELYAGNVATSARILEEGCAALDRVGDRANLATRAADLAEVMFALGRVKEADRWCTLSEETGADDDVWTQIAWRTARAKLLGHADKLAEAEKLARAVVALAEPTDALNHRAKAQLDLAEILGLGGPSEEARKAVEEALALFCLKGNVAGASLAESRLAGLAPA
jgi:tetratricopeptide (TPR) repeat protein